jgi:hypothetical protein
LSCPARAVFVNSSFNDSDDGGMHLRGGYERNDPVRMQPGGEMEEYLVQMKDPDSWVTPRPPVQEVSTVSIKSIYLREMALEVKVAAMGANKELTEQQVANQTEYRASIVFSIVTYVLYTNPVFVSVTQRGKTAEMKPICESFHFSRDQNNIWTVERLKDHMPDDFEYDYDHQCDREGCELSDSKTTKASSSKCP